MVALCPYGGEKEEMAYWAEVVVGDFFGLAGRGGFVAYLKLSGWHGERRRGCSAVRQAVTSVVRSVDGDNADNTSVRVCEVKGEEEEEETCCVT